MAGLLKQYFGDIRRLGKSSDFVVLIAATVIFVCGLVVSLLDFESQTPQSRLGLSTVAGVVLFALGSFLRIQARRTLSRYWSPVARVLPDHVLVTHGVYKYIRHPGYLGEMLIFLSLAVVLNSGYGTIAMALILPFVLYRIRIEEGMLLKEFGEGYRAYARRTRRLIPYIY